MKSSNGCLVTILVLVTGFVLFALFVSVPLIRKGQFMGFFTLILMIMGVLLCAQMWEFVKRKKK